MSKNQMIDSLFSELSDQRNMYGWTVGIFITLILAFIGVQWYVNTKQAKRIKENVLNSIQQSNKKKMDSLFNMLIDDIKNKLDYMSKLDNKNADEVRFITQEIRNRTVIIYDFVKENNELNKYLHKIVDAVDNASNSMNKHDDSNDVVWEGFRMISKGITFNAQWDENYVDNHSENKNQQ